MNLLTFAERLAGSDRSAVTFHPERCLYALDKDATCSACFTCCPAQAIAAGSPPTLDSEKCQSCLACLPLCPTGAYSADDSVTNLLTCAARLENSALELVCGLHPQPEMGAAVSIAGMQVHGCLAGLGAGALMALAALGFKQIDLCVDACAECPWGSLRPQIEAQVAETQRLLAPWGKAEVLSLRSTLENPLARPLWRAEDPPLSRRDLFRVAAFQSKVTLARAMENGEASEPRQPGRDRLRKLKAAFALGEPLDTQLPLPASDFAALYATEACTACGACERACPTEALALRTDAEKSRFQLVFYAQNCIACGFCLRACAPNALLMEGLPPFEQVFRTQLPGLLQDGELRRCDRCNTPFAARPGVKLCPTCQYRQSHPFGSQMPPGFKPVVLPKDTSQ